MSGSGMHPLIRTGIATGLRALGPSLLNLLVRKIEGNGREKKRIHGGLRIIRRPILGVGHRVVHHRKPRTVTHRVIRRVRPIKRVGYGYTAGAWQLPGAGYHHKRKTVTHKRKTVKRVGGMRKTRVIHRRILI